MCSQRINVLVYVRRSAGQASEREGQCRGGAEKRKRDDYMRDCQLVREEMVTFLINRTETVVIMIPARAISR